MPNPRLFLTRSCLCALAVCVLGALASSAPAAAAPGDLDPTFGGTGILTTDVVAGNQDLATAAATDPLGRAWVAGSSFGPAGDRIAVARYRPAGLDPTFGSGGRLSIAAGPGAGGSDILAYTYNPPGQPSTTRALIAGSVVVNGSPRPLVAAIRGNGVLDPTWSGDGLLSHAVPGATEAVLSGIAYDDGKIVVAGRAVVGGRNHALVARYTDDGQLDPTFSGDGVQTLRARRTIDGVSVPADSTSIKDVVVDGGHIVLAGSAHYPGLPLNDDESALAMGVRGDGTLDTLWGSGGMQHVGFGAGDDGFSAAVMQSHKIVLAGGRDKPDPVLGARGTAVTARLDSAGRLDLSYGGGNGITSWHPGRHLTATDVTLAGGRIVVACGDTGDVNDPNGDDTFTVLRYLANGDADLPWGGGDAEVRANVSPGGYERAYAVSLLYSTVNPSPPPTILVAGEAFVNSQFRFGVVSLRAF
jgi:uncharacterized delta-60 repeat protein